MAESLTTQFSGQLSYDHSWDDQDTGRPLRDHNSIARIHDLTYGTAANQLNKMWEQRRTVLNGNNDDLDLAGGSLLDKHGVGITFAKIKLIYVRNLNSQVGHNLIIGGAANAFASWLGGTTQTLNLGPDGELKLFNPSNAGYTVTPTTGDILRVTGSGADITYDIMLWGTST